MVTKIKHTVFEYPEWFIQVQISIKCDKCNSLRMRDEKSDKVGEEHTFVDSYGTLLDEWVKDDDTIWVHRLACMQCGKAYEIYVTKQEAKVFPVGFIADVQKQHPILKAMEDWAV